MTIMPWDPRQGQNPETPWGMGPMGLPSGVFGAGMQTAGALESLLGGMRQPQQSYPANPEAAGNIFGIKGKFGDFLGKLGDALLIGDGADPIYAARKQQMAMSEAMSGFDPEDPMPTIRRRMLFDQKGAQEMLKEYREWQDKNTDNKREDSKHTLDRLDKEDGFRRTIGAMLRSSNPGTYGQMSKRVQDYAKLRGIDMSDMPNDYNEEYNNGWYMSGIAPKDSLAAERLESHRQFDRADRVADNARQTADDAEQIRHNKTNESISQHRAVSGRISATKPTGSRGSSGPSAGVAAKVGGLPDKFIGYKVRNKVTGKVAVWNESKGKYE